MKQKITVIFILSSSFFFNSSLGAAYFDDQDQTILSAKREPNELLATSQLKRRKILEGQNGNLISSNEKSYKAILVPLENEFYIRIVPKESFIKKAIGAEFIPGFIKLERVSIRPYAADLVIAEQIKKLPIFKDLGMMIPDMKNGHIKLSNNDEEHVDRGYIVRDNENKVHGCVHLAYYFGANSCVIEALGIEPTCAAQGLGSSLLQTAICVASLYGSEHVDVQSTPESLGIYAKHGFWFCDNGYGEENIPWEDFASLESDVLRKHGDENSHFMKLDFANDKHLKILERYMARHAKPVISFSQIIKDNRERISGYRRQFENLEELNQEDDESKALARKEFENISQHVEFPENILKLLGML